MERKAFPLFWLQQDSQLDSLDKESDVLMTRISQLVHRSTLRQTTYLEAFPQRWSVHTCHSVWTQEGGRWHPGTATNRTLAHHCRTWNYIQPATVKLHPTSNHETTSNQQPWNYIQPATMKLHPISNHDTSHRENRFQLTFFVKLNFYVMSS